MCVRVCVGGPYRLTFFPDNVYQDVDHYERSCPPDPRTEEHERQSLGELAAHLFHGSLIPVNVCVFMCVPAVYRNRSSIQDALLLQVDLLQEVKDAAGVRWNAVVGPGPEVVLPNGALRVALRARRSQEQLLTSSKLPKSSGALYGYVLRFCPKSRTNNVTVCCGAFQHATTTHLE